MASHDKYGIAAEADVAGKANGQIWFYFILLGAMLFATIVGLTIMYTFQVDYEKTRKIGEVNTRESTDQMALSESYLLGKRGLFSDKRHVPVEEAMKKFVSDVRGVQK